MGRRSIVMAVVAAFAVVAAGCGATPGGPASPVATRPPPGATGPSAGCGTTTQGPVTDAADTVSVDGVVRRYTITVPPEHVVGTTAPVPLVLDFHGLLEGWAGTHPFATQFSAKAGAEGFAVAYPIGSDDGIYWDVSLQEANPDLRFVDALVDRLETSMCIDRSRLYITGLSYGAFMTSMLMCMRANTFAAAAPVAGIRNPCTATERRVPFVTFHGTSDPILPYPAYAAVPQAIATKYGCVDEPSTTTLRPDPDPSTHGPIIRTVWDCGAVGSAVESYRIGGGGHSWPGSQFFSWIGGIVGPTASSIDATDVIWDFFGQHHL
ncbi:alpha/beta hydrolase family esterase [Dermatobacter hominis]|uniref:alpha/beta hydrolase family esterase n=1 Tax=Dermatobacter hominis TaxID=2884263 RepID=UPI001D10E6D8|nr:prolyl oligopeptidase family serine peptidase [Dermatobacter hominis]UDY37593.1 prolyl oligopeptidase family serine peptidase [Dermatobacter hominis]